MTAIGQFKVSYVVIDFGIGRKPLYDFLLVNNTNSRSISYFSDLLWRIGQIIVFDMRCLYLTCRFQGWTSELWTAKFGLKTTNITLSCDVQNIST